jgi:predicted amidohydrolase YtcJ
MLSVLAVVLTHAHVLTMSPAQPTATTLAVVDGRVAYVGDDEAAARRAAGPAAEQLDLGGRTVMPGFNDAHAHFGVGITFGGSKGVDVPELPAKKWLAAVAEAARTRPPRDWLFVTTPELPAGVRRGEALDFLGRPVFVVSRHGGVLNHRAMALAHVKAAEAPGGFVSGREISVAIIRAVRAQPKAELLADAASFVGELSRLGITSVQLIAHDELPDVFEALRLDGRLTVRVRMVPFGFRFGDRLYHSEWAAPAPDWVRVDGVKYFHDDWARLTRFDFQKIFDEVTRAGHFVVLHVLSRHALQTFLDELELYSQGKPEVTRWFRIDHVDEATRAQAERLARLHVLVCATPAMLPQWRSEHAFPLRTLLDAGVKLCLGTDWLGRHTPPRPLAPLWSVQTAVTHGGFGTAERIGALEALTAYTAGSAAAEGEEEDKGMLLPGMFADLVVLSADPMTRAPERLGEIDVLLTMVGGRVVHRLGGFGAPPPSTIGRPVLPQPTIGPPSPMRKR